MNFKIGDKISVLDRNIKGVIKSLTRYKAVLIDEDGFEEEFSLNKLVKISKIEDYKSSFSAIVIDKEIKKDFKQSKKKIIRGVKVIDLHMDKLSESQKGMTNHDIVLYQLNAVEKIIRETDKRYFLKIVFIHGLGTGKLRKELEYLLKRKSIFFQDANYRKYGRGALEVLL